jgi:uncharacterized protein (DUF1800 family)
MAANSALDKVDPVKAWQPWQPGPADPWNLKWAGHLYRRAGFGATLTELREAIALGYQETMDRILTGAAGGERFQREVLDQAGARMARKSSPYDLRGWWLYCMLNGPHPLREKMTLFWHNHFATSIAKVGHTTKMFNQNRTLRQNALGKFKPFLLDMSRDAAMLVWLDSNSNVKGKPNENYAREVMELFSLGVGNYTEKDIREAARAFTGWHTDDDQFDFVPALHDDGSKTVLGQTGNWNGDDIVRIVLEQPAAARFLARKLYRFLINEAANPPDALIEPLARFYRDNDYDTGALVKVMLRSRHFFSEHAYRQRIKSPVEYVLGAVRAVTTGTIQQAALLSRLDSMGQQLFAPPNVKGWVGGQAWLNTATVLARHNFAQVAASGQLRVSELEQRLASASSELERQVIEQEERARAEQEAAQRAQGQKPPRPPEPPANPNTDPAELIHQEKLTDPEKIVALLLDLFLQGDVSKPARGKLVAFLSEGKPAGLDGRIREVVHAIVTMPEYQLA